MPWILSVMPRSEPSDVGTDETGLLLSSFEVLVLESKSSSTLDALGKILQDAGVGVIGTSILFTSAARVPRTPTIVLKDAGGFASVKTQNNVRHHQRVAIRVLASAVTQRAAHTLAWKAYHALEVVRNKHV